MQISTVFALVVAFLASDVSAGCYTSGQEWGDRDAAKSVLHDACGSMNGLFASGEVKRQCRNMPSGQNSYVFEVQNMDFDGQESITFDDCYNYISRQINGCSRGGDETIYPMRYR